MMIPARANHLPFESNRTGTASTTHRAAVTRSRKAQAGESVTVKTALFSPPGAANRGRSRLSRRRDRLESRSLDFGHFPLKLDRCLDAPNSGSRLTANLKTMDGPPPSGRVPAVDHDRLFKELLTTFFLSSWISSSPGSPRRSTVSQSNFFPRNCSRIFWTARNIRRTYLASNPLYGVRA